MTVHDIQSLIDLLGDSSTVTDLAVTAADGSSVSVKRSLAARSSSLVSYRPTPGYYTVSLEEIAQEGVFAQEDTGGIISSPLVGTFQATNPPISEGSLIRLGQIVGYIESMKLMSELKSDVEGLVTQVH